MGRAWTVVPYLLLVLAFGIPSHAEWIQDGGNVTTTANDLGPYLAIAGNIPYITWLARKENSSDANVYIKRFNGNSWSLEGVGKRFSGGVFFDCDFYDENLYASIGQWYSTDFVKFYQIKNGVWIQQGSDVSSVRPSDVCLGIDHASGLIYVGQLTQLAPSQLLVKHWDGGAWVADGGALNANTQNAAYTPDIAVLNGIPYVCWSESNSGVAQVFIRSYSGSSWTPSGECLNVNPAFSATSPRLIADAGVLYACWSESDGAISKIYVKTRSLAESSWALLGSGCLNINPANALSPSLAIANGKPHVAWTEFAGGSAWKIYVKRWNGQTWELLGGELNVDPTQHAQAPSLAISGSVPYVAWKEGNNAYVKHFVFPVAPTPSASPTQVQATFTPTSTVTPASSVLETLLDVRNTLIENHRSCLFNFTLREETKVSLILYNLRGEKVCALIDNEVLPPGEYQESWGGWNEKNSPVAAGIYLANFKAGSYRKTIKVAVTR